MSRQQRSTLQSGVCNESAPELAEAEEVSTEPYGMSELPVESEACVPPADAFYAAVSDPDLPAALEAWGLLGAAEQQTFRGDPATLASVANGWDLLDAAALFGTMNLPALETLLGSAPGRMADGLEGGDLAVMGLFHRDPLPWLDWMRAELTPARFAQVLSDFAIDAHTQLGYTGLFEGSPDWAFFMTIVSQIPEVDRILALQEVRAQDKWAELLDNLTAEHVPMVQAWLAEDAGDDTGQSLEDRIAAAQNSARATAALGIVDGYADPANRITPRIRELLALGVALPKLEGADLASEGVLSQNQVLRALQALTAMDDREYVRLGMLLEMTGNDDSSLTQSFLLLEATAARAEEFGRLTLPGLDPITYGNLDDLEHLSDAMRGQTNEEVVDMTSPVQTAEFTGGYTQRMTMGCGPSAMIVARAEADPVEALRMREEHGMDPDHLDNDWAREEEAALERGHAGQTAEPRRGAMDVGDVVAAANDPANGLTAAERLAVVAYVRGGALDANAQSGLVKVEAGMGDLYPGAEALRMASEAGANATSSNARFGLNPTELQGEANGQMGVDEVSGAAVGDNTDWTNLGSYDSTNHTPAQMGSWSGSIQALITPTRARLEQGEDVVFQVRWDPAVGVGGHFMTLLNVRTDDAGAYSYLIHDTWNGNTAWVTETDLVGGNLAALGFAPNNLAVVWSTN